MVNSIHEADWSCFALSFISIDDDQHVFLVLCQNQLKHVQPLAQKRSHISLHEIMLMCKHMHHFHVLFCTTKVWCQTMVLYVQCDNAHPSTSVTITEVVAVINLVVQRTSKQKTCTTRTLYLYHTPSFFVRNRNWGIQQNYLNDAIKKIPLNYIVGVKSSPASFCWMSLYDGWESQQKMHRTRGTKRHFMYSQSRTVTTILE